MHKDIAIYIHFFIKNNFYYHAKRYLHTVFFCKHKLWMSLKVKLGMKKARRKIQLYLFWKLVITVIAQRREESGSARLDMKTN